MLSASLNKTFLSLSLSLLHSPEYTHTNKLRLKIFFKDDNYRKLRIPCYVSVTVNVCLYQMLYLKYGSFSIVIYAVSDFHAWTYDSDGGWGWGGGGSALPISGKILREMGSCPFISVHFWDYQPETSYAHVGIHIQFTLFYRDYFL